MNFHLPYRQEDSITHKQSETERVDTLLMRYRVLLFFLGFFFFMLVRLTQQTQIKIWAIGLFAEFSSSGYGGKVAPSRAAQPSGDPDDPLLFSDRTRLHVIGLLTPFAAEPALLYYL